MFEFWINNFSKSNLGVVCVRQFIKRISMGASQGKKKDAKKDS